MTRTLSIDVETYSSVDLKSCGAYKYVESEDFEVLLFAYAYDDDPPAGIDLAQGEEIPQSVIDDIYSSNFRSCAWNATFERLCLSKHFGRQIPTDRWIDTMVIARVCGLPGSLGKAAEALELAEQKDKAGTQLINFFSKPCKPTARNNGRTRNLPHHDPDKWELFKQYNLQDVKTEHAIYTRLQFLINFNNVEWELWRADQDINDRGVRIDIPMVRDIVEHHDEYLAELLEESKEITGLDNPQSLPQLKGWLNEQGLEVDSLCKGDVDALLEDSSIPMAARRVLENRQALGKTSVKKYDSMLNAACEDDRVRGILQFYGANRTGRWSGRIIQPQNLPRNYLKEIPDIRDTIHNGNIDTLELVYDSVSDVYSQLIRTAIIPTEGKQFYVFDYSAIEARIIAWLAKEQWAIDVFNGDGKVYEATASKMFKVPIDKVTKDLRQRGKVAVLALGYQGGVGALKAMGALNMGLEETELPGIVSKWREANPSIVNLWATVEDRAVTALTTDKLVPLNDTETPLVHFSKQLGSGNLLIELPSGRRLYYQDAKVVYGARGPKITYQGMDTNVWAKIDTYGGKLTENIVQAIARDCLANAILALDKQGYEIVFHVHDEIVIEGPIDGAGAFAQGINEIMSTPPEWAEGLKLPAEGFTSPYYTKD